MPREHRMAARRLVSAFSSHAADNFLAIADEIDSSDGWKAVAIALIGDVASLAYEVHGEQTQYWLDERIAKFLDRHEDPGGHTR